KPARGAQPPFDVTVSHVTPSSLEIEIEFGGVNQSSSSEPEPVPIAAHPSRVADMQISKNDKRK
ncbi:MAG: hypothetical protein O3A01_07845, partial [bacterium]|nr:hypothetical protein [bacterium]